MNEGDPVLLPSSLERSPILIRFRPKSEIFYDGNLSVSQKNAVVAILNAQSRPDCHILIGLKQSGKTRVLVESILQVSYKAPYMNTLIICRSRDAAKSLVNRLLGPDSAIFANQNAALVRSTVSIRHFAADQYVVEARLSKNAHKACNKLLSNYYNLQQELNLAKIIVMANEESLVKRLKSSQIIFNYVMVDDADTMTKSEILAAKSLTDPHDGLCVLSGDISKTNTSFARLVCNGVYLSYYLRDSAFTSALSKIKIVHSYSNQPSQRRRRRKTEKSKERNSPIQTGGHNHVNQGQKKQPLKKTHGTSNQSASQADATDPLGVDNYNLKLNKLLTEEKSKIIEKYADLTLENIRFSRQIGRWLRKDVDYSGNLITKWIDVLGFNFPESWHGSKRMLTPGTFLEFRYESQVFSGRLAMIRHDMIWIDFDCPADQLIDTDPFLRCSFKVVVLPNLVSIERCLAAAQVTKIFSTLFPTRRTDELSPILDITRDELEFICPDLDDTQKTAVVGVVRGACRPSPYLIFGPPGTGKTVTLIESILQVYLRQPSSRILVCGNTNACTDMIATLLLKSGELELASGKYDLVRLKSRHRMEQDEHLPEYLVSVTIMTKMAKFKALKRIVVTTCNSAAYLQKKSSFDYIFIDESGHAIEPDILIPLICMKDSGLLVLAGDPFQLAPVVQSEYAAEHGLKMSLLERLFCHEIYKPEVIKGVQLKYNNVYMTQLTTCRRSDQRIMSPSNVLFYDHQVVCTNHTPPELLRVMNSELPLIFQEQSPGHEIREGSSWFNVHEAFDCVYLARKIVLEANYEPHQIGVIAFYRSQVEQMERIFASDALLKDCKIATVDEFQGQERDIILISTVRSSRTTGKRSKFMFDAKRFNVAVSRARYLVVAFGDRKLLELDPNWEMYLKLACIKPPL